MDNSGCIKLNYFGSLNHISMNTYLGDCIIKIKLNLTSLEEEYYIKSIHLTESKLKKGDESSIDRHQNAWCLFFWLDKKIDNILTAINELGIITPTTKNGMYKIKIYWEIIYREFYELISILKDEGILTPKERIKHYPTLSYMYVYRNEFMTHPKFKIHFDSAPMHNAAYSGNKLLPSFSGQTGGIGSTVLCEYFKIKSTYKKPWNNVEIIMKKNKRILMDKGSLKKLDEKEVAQIKGWGLPCPINDQQEIGVEFMKLFLEKLFPELKQRINKVFKNQLLASDTHLV
ncbi:MAG: hypothetical protein PHZ00_06540 [Candidatus Peribacteraceae bacterium]|nr:hypothetical protein [Candidatus Peribacteraceae bacterium]